MTRVSPDKTREGSQFLMRRPQERLQQSQLVHDLEGGGVDCVAAKVAQEVGVLFENNNVDAGAREKKSQHHPGGSTASDAATRGDLIGHSGGMGRLRGNVFPRLAWASLATVGPTPECQP